MTQTIKHTIEELPNLRLPELQAYYAEVLGEPTRCPNKKFLIRRITETLAEQTERQSVIAEEPAQPVSIATSEADKVEAAETEPAAPQPATEPEPATELAEPEPATAPAELEPATEPGELVEAAPATETTKSEAAAEPADPPSTPGASTTASAAGDKPLTKLSVEELQQRYQNVVGRSTGSSHRRYLIWKIRQAENGKIPVGPRKARKQRSSDEPTPEFKVLPLRMEAGVVERLDEARERLGLKNRMELFRSALNSYLAAQGESDVAALFAR